MNKWIVICVFLIISLSSSLVIILWGSTFNLHTTDWKNWSRSINGFRNWFLFWFLCLAKLCGYSGLSVILIIKISIQILTEIEQRSNGVSTYDRWNELNLRRNLNYQTRHKPLLGIVGDVNLLFQSLPELASQSWIETPDAFFIDLQQGTPPKIDFIKHLLMLFYQSLRMTI